MTEIAAQDAAPPAPATGQDYLVYAVTAAKGNPVLERIRAQGAEVVLSVYRLLKTALLHQLHNDAVAQAIERAHATIAAFAEVIGMNVSLTFVEQNIFVCGQLLRASRGAYESAIELADLCARVGVSEIAIAPDVPPDSYRALVVTLVQALRDQSGRTKAAGADIVGITLRSVDPALERRERPSALHIKERIVRAYASALVVMRQYFAALAAGAAVMPHRVKRLGQSLVTIADSGDPAALGMVAMAAVHRDDASRSVHTALLAVIAAQRLTRDRVTLTRLATAALLVDAGRAVQTGAERQDRLVDLPEDEAARMPAMTGELAVTTGGINFANAVRTVVAFESSWLDFEEQMGPPYEGIWDPVLPSQLIALVRRLIDHIAPRDRREAVSPLEALRLISQDPSMDPGLLRVLLRAVGVVPTGSVVELSTREWAVVLSESKAPGALHRPRIAIVTNASGRALPTPREVDLGLGGDSIRIVKVLGPSAAKLNVASVFLSMR